MAERPTSRLRLRTRLILAFGLGGVVLASAVSAITYGIVRNTLLDRRETAAVQTFSNNVARVESRVFAEETTLEEIRLFLVNLGTAGGARNLLRLDTDWITSDTLVFGSENVDAALLSAVVDQPGRTALMRYEVRGEPFLVAGTGFGERTAVYFEATSLRDISETLRSLAITLLVASAVTTVGGIGLGFWASRRVLQPLTDVSAAARAIAVGDLDTRLEAEHDADLEPLTESFNNMAASLQEKIERDGRFASDVSHELRSPLMTVMTSVEILKAREDELPERAQLALNLLSDDLQRFRQLVEDLLEISRFDVGAAQLEVDEFDVGELVRQSVRYSGHELELDIPADPLVIEADRRRLARALANLLDNAENYGGGPTRVSARATDDGVELVVEDAGPGVPEAERSRIFDRFARGAEGGRRGSGTGTGLGLALVAEHVRLHGGTTRVEDRQDGESGARFVIELPQERP